MNWHLSHRADPRALPLADRHYNRQKIGSPQFVPPGRCIVLLAETALWVTSWPFARYVRHDWAGAWVNSCFRREGGPLASELIREALAATLCVWANPPRLTCRHCGFPVSLVTFVDRDEVRRKRDPGRCYIRAGFRRCTATTKGGLVVVHIGYETMPAAEAPLGYQSLLLEATR